MNKKIKPALIIGAGGHSKVLAECLNLLSIEIIGFIYKEISKVQKIPGGPFLEEDKVLDKYDPNEVNLVNGIGFMPNNNKRHEISSDMRNRGFKFLTIIHPSVAIPESVKIDEGVQIMSGSVIQPGVQIGKDTIINTGVILDHDCNIGMNCHLATGVKCSGNVTIQKHTFIGTGTSIINDINVGENSVIAAGSTIFRDIPDNTTIIQKKHNMIAE